MAEGNPEVAILVVEDIQDMRNIICRMLRMMGYENVTEARNGYEAQSLIEQSGFRLVLCDWNMPGMTGQQLLENVRMDKRFADLPFIMITGDGGRAKVQDAVSAGVSGFIVKPFTMKTLEARIKEVLGQGNSAPSP